VQSAYGSYREYDPWAEEKFVCIGVNAALRNNISIIARSPLPRTFIGSERYGDAKTILDMILSGEKIRGSYRNFYNIQDEEAESTRLQVMGLARVLGFSDSISDDSNKPLSIAEVFNRKARDSQ